MQRSGQKSWSLAGKGVSVVMTAALLGVGFTLASCETTPRHRFDYNRDDSPKKKKKYPTPGADCASAPFATPGVFAFGLGPDVFAFVTPAAAADRQDRFDMVGDGSIRLAGGGGDGGEGFKRCLDF